MSILFLIKCNLRNSPTLDQVWLDGENEKYCFRKEDRKFSNINRYHPLLKAKLKFKSNQFRSSKTLRIPLGNKEIFDEYHVDSRFSFKVGDKIVSLIRSENLIPEVRKVPRSEVAKQLCKLKYVHEEDCAQAFLDKLKRTFKDADITDESFMKMEILRFFKVKDRPLILSNLKDFNFDEVCSKFFGLYKDCKREKDNYLLNLEYKDAKSLERFIEEKLEFYKKMLSNPTFKTIKVLLNCHLPEKLTRSLNFELPSLSSLSSLIEYILIKADDIKFDDSKPTRKKDERSDNEHMEDEEIEEEEIDTDNSANDLLKSYPKSNNDLKK